jgi:Na+-translocating ferredoxin:NAD+ oxidoreductase RnfG subunit
MNAFVALPCAAVLLLAAAGDVRAERYLTADEARKLAFPAAEQIEELTFRFSAAETAQIEKKCSLKLRNSSARCLVVRNGTTLVGVLVLDQALGKHEMIDYAVAINPDGRVLQVEVLEYRESQGREVRSAKWRGQFKDKSADSALRLNQDIYNISGATISCRSVTEGVRRVLATFEVAIKPRLAQPSPRAEGQSPAKK